MANKQKPSLNDSAGGSNRKGVSSGARSSAVASSDTSSTHRNTTNKGQSSLKSRRSSSNNDRSSSRSPSNPHHGSHGGGSATNANADPTLLQNFIERLSQNMSGPNQQNNSNVQSSNNSHPFQSQHQGNHLMQDVDPAQAQYLLEASAGDIELAISLYWEDSIAHAAVQQQQEHVASNSRGGDDANKPKSERKKRGSDPLASSSSSSDNQDLISGSRNQSKVRSRPRSSMLAAIKSNSSPSSSFLPNAPVSLSMPSQYMRSTSGATAKNSARASAKPDSARTSVASKKTDKDIPEDTFESDMMDLEEDPAIPSSLLQQMEAAAYDQDSSGNNSKDKSNQKSPRDFPPRRLRRNSLRRRASRDGDVAEPLLNREACDNAAAASAADGAIDVDADVHVDADAPAIPAQANPNNNPNENPNDGNNPRRRNNDPSASAVSDDEAAERLLRMVQDEQMREHYRSVFFRMGKKSRSKSKRRNGNDEGDASRHRAQFSQRRRSSSNYGHDALNAAIGTNNGVDVGVNVCVATNANREDRESESSQSSLVASVPENILNRKKHGRGVPSMNPSRKGTIGRRKMAPTSSSSSDDGREEERLRKRRKKTDQVVQNKSSAGTKRSHEDHADGEDDDNPIDHAKKMLLDQTKKKLMAQMGELYPDDETDADADADTDNDNKDKSETGSNVAVASVGGMGYSNGNKMEAYFDESDSVDSDLPENIHPDFKDSFADAVPTDGLVSGHHVLWGTRVEQDFFKDGTNHPKINDDCLAEKGDDKSQSSNHPEEIIHDAVADIVRNEGDNDVVEIEQYSLDEDDDMDDSSNLIVIPRTWLSAGFSLSSCGTGIILKDPQDTELIRLKSIQSVLYPRNVGRSKSTGQIIPTPLPPYHCGGITSIMSVVTALLYTGASIQGREVNCNSTRRKFGELNAEEKKREFPLRLVDALSSLLFTATRPGIQRRKQIFEKRLAEQRASQNDKELKKRQALQIRVNQISVCRWEEDSQNGGGLKIPLDQLLDHDDNLHFSVSRTNAKDLKQFVKSNIKSFMGPGGAVLLLEIIMNIHGNQSLERMIQKARNTKPEDKVKPLVLCTCEKSQKQRWETQLHGETKKICCKQSTNNLNIPDNPDCLNIELLNLILTGDINTKVDNRSLENFGFGILTVDDMNKDQSLVCSQLHKSLPMSVWLVRGSSTYSVVIQDRGCGINPFADGSFELTHWNPWYNIHNETKIKVLPERKKRTSISSVYSSKKVDNQIVQSNIELEESQMDHIMANELSTVRVHPDDEKLYPKDFKRWRFDFGVDGVVTDGSDSDEKQSINTSSTWMDYYKLDKRQRRIVEKKLSPAIHLALWKNWPNAYIEFCPISSKPPIV